MVCLFNDTGEFVLAMELVNWSSWIVEWHVDILDASLLDSINNMYKFQ